MGIDVTENQGESVKVRGPRRLRICIYSLLKIFRDWDNISPPQMYS
jgi:hypothetical protein